VGALRGAAGALWRDEEGAVGTEWKGKGSGEDIDESIYIIIMYAR
jgi:hypothetical protein